MRTAPVLRLQIWVTEHGSWVGHRLVGPLNLDVDRVGVAVRSRADVLDPFLSPAYFHTHQRSRFNYASPCMVEWPREFPDSALMPATSLESFWRRASSTGSVRGRPRGLAAHAHHLGVGPRSLRFSGPLGSESAPVSGLNRPPGCATTRAAMIRVTSRCVALPRVRAGTAACRRGLAKGVRQLRPRNRTQTLSPAWQGRRSPTKPRLSRE